LATPEARVLEWIAHRLPAAVKPDHLTALGVVAALGIAVTYVLVERRQRLALGRQRAAAAAALARRLARRDARPRAQAERPRYGYHLDHLVDTFATAAIGIGLVLSPYMLLAVGLAGWARAVGARRAEPVGEELLPS